MELLYVYIDKYRNFAKQGIHFSNKFKLSYSESDSKKKLTIDKNKDYIDIYPKNIAGVTAIAGKNASGKTSLLDLVGTKIRSRFKNEELIKLHQEYPHKIANVLEELERERNEKVVHVSNYFLVFYAGKDKGIDLFIFESNHPQKYIDIFANKEIADLVDETNKFQKRDHESKCWFSYVFTKSNNDLTLLDTPNNYTLENGDSISDKSGIILFKNIFRNNPYNHQTDYENWKFISRRHAILQSQYLYNQVEFLINQMDKNTLRLFNCPEYELVIDLYDMKKCGQYSHSERFNYDERIKDYKRFFLSKVTENSSKITEKQKNTLAFLYNYVYYLFVQFVDKDSDNTKDKKACITCLLENDIEQPTYSEIKKYYRNQIQEIINYANTDYITLAEYKKVEQAVENLFEKADECHIAISYKNNQLTLGLNKKTSIIDIKSFFTDCLDELRLKHNDKKNSVMHDYVRTNINFLSEGEQANLAMYTSIDEQLRIYTDSTNIHVRTITFKREKYILLFDEMEQSMHPEMCRKLLSSLMKFLGSYKGKSFQIIIASHSPFVISDILKENLIRLYRENNIITVKPLEENSFGQNIHTLLKNDFYLKNTYGEYSKKLIQEIASWLKDDKGLVTKINNFLNPKVDKERIQEFPLNSEKDEEATKEVTPNSTKDEGSRKEVVSTPAEAYDYLGKVIACIGEPILRNYLQKKLQERQQERLQKNLEKQLNPDKHMSIENKIKYLEKMLQEAKDTKSINDKSKEEGSDDNV